MALELFSSVRYLLRPEEISIDNWVFRLHYRLTVLFLVGSSFIGVAKQYFGDPINCQASVGMGEKAVLVLVCFLLCLLKPHQAFVAS